MLIDLLNSANYIMVNIDAIHILGLNTAVYCSELLNIYKKAVIKKKIYNEKYFKIDRDYIEKHSSISVEDQLKCDANLGKAGIIKADNQDPDLIFFDVEIYASILASEDVKLLNSVEKAVNIKTKDKFSYVIFSALTISIIPPINTEMPKKVLIGSNI